MIEALSISGFRTFSSLEVERLGRLNLIVGRNNVGKSYLLDALHLVGARGSQDVLRAQLAARDELVETHTADPAQPSARFFYEGLFHGRPADLTVSAPIEFSLRTGGEAGSTWAKCQILTATSDPPASWSDPRPALAVSGGPHGGQAERRFELPFRAMADDIAVDLRETAQLLVPARGLARELLMRMWDTLILRGAEAEALRFLSLIEDVERLTLVQTPGRRGRTPMLHRRGEALPVPLASLGDGMWRAFELGTALCSVAGRPNLSVSETNPRVHFHRMVLIDELENGLHYSALPALWEAIAETALRSDVQVFATTHSWDCARAFAELGSQRPDLDAQIVRLARRGGETRAFVFAGDDLASIEREGIEVR